jgi:hypothetical protein
MRKKTFNLKSSSLFAVLFCTVGLFLTTTISAQIPAGCGSLNCTSQDVKIETAYLTDLSNNALSCSGNTPITSYRLHLIVSTKTPRIGVYINCTLNITSSGTTTSYPVSNCFDVALIGNANDLTVDFNNQSLACGSSATITEAFTSWGTGNTSFCPGSCPETKAKCRFVPGEVIIVQTFPCTPATTSGPTSDTKCAGASKTFSATFSAGPNTTITGVQWQIYNTGTSAWDNLSTTGVYTADNDNTSPATLAISDVTGLNGKRYRVLISSNSASSGQNCSTAPEATLTVDPASAGGAVGSAQTICSGSTASALTLSGNTGSVVKWQKSTDNFVSNTTDIANTTTTLSPGALTQDTWYRAVVQSGVCASANSTPVKITVDVASVGGTVASAQTICSGSSASALTLSGKTGNVVKWQKSTDNFVSNTTDIANTTTTLSPGALTQDTWYRAVVQNGVCASANSNIIKITVGAIPGKPEFTITQPSLCGPSTGSINICQTIVGYNYLVPGKTTKSGDGNAYSFTGLGAGTNPTLEVVNATGGCSSGTFTCSDAVSVCSTSSSSRARTDAITSESTLSETTVKAYPNPFSDRVKFLVTSSEGGNGSLEVYNMMGQKVKTVYTGFIAAGTQTFELGLPSQRVANLVYVLRIGDKKVTGKILQVNK